MAPAHRRSCCFFVASLLLLQPPCLTFVSWQKRVQRTTQLRTTANKRWWCEAGGIESKLRDVFHSNMQIDDVPLLADFDSYAASLPVRERPHDLPIKLFQCPFYATEENMKKFAKRISTVDQSIRSTIAYVAAAAKSGKSSSVLPGFLHSISMGVGLNFSHYLYMPFHNNDRRHHTRVSTQDLEVYTQEQRFRLGAMYMRDCFRAQAFGSPSSYERDWKLPATVVDIRKTQTLLDEDVQHFMKRSPDGVLLLHVDEHRKMCDDVDFRKGAMAVMATSPQVRVLATFIDIVPQPAEGSSGICRYAVCKPPLDVRTVMEQLPRLAVPMATTADEQRHLASLRVTLGLALTELGLAGLHVKDDRWKAFLDGFTKLVETGSEKEIYAKCIQYCNQQWMNEGPRRRRHLVDLLCGIEESDGEVQEQRYSAVVSLEKTLTAPLEVLLRDADPDDTDRLLFEQCQSLFMEAFGTADFASGSVLERAYLWTLACKTTRPGSIRFCSVRPSFECKQVAAARIFKDNALMLDNVKALKQNTLYYADEKGKSHPLADMWLLSQDNVLFLLEVSGTSNVDGANKTVTRLKDALEGQDLDSLSVDGIVAIVLLPNIMEDLSSDNSVLAIAGSPAQKLLGGLVQLLDWLGSVD
eukprot:TRINITY_DN76673_c0_g1_i1.p1 TRINITY_DN76673_c0_g1~~TRINITY_DN76673_c0_g1_i1.p1  ORF type:complete len:639 (+),score=120.71 TRINITY_DN76673_c0_g1_i1:92-2008(+)